MDSLWDVADEVIGDDYEINEAEAFVLGGAFLLHDAAHVVSAYKGGLAEIKATPEWKDFVALRLNGDDPAPGSEGEHYVLFNVVRDLHAIQAEKLPFICWEDSAGDPSYLIEDLEIRAYFGEIIGEVAASHHWSTYEVAERFHGRMLTPAGFLTKSSWKVDVLKVALILRTADAAHVDSRRAPLFLSSLRKPKGVSKVHWDFQGAIGRLTRQPNGELRMSSGASFDIDRRAAWWMAFDTARMIDGELKSAQSVLMETSRPVFAATGVMSSSSAAAFAKVVPVKGWEPVDVHPKIGDVPHLIERLGGYALYGDKPEVAIREMLQNSIDACAAHEHLCELGNRRITVGISKKEADCWQIFIQDNGIGMSKYVLTEVLLDFGKSLWSSHDMIRELPSLASLGFTAGGKFGIGFYSIFMLGAYVSVVTRRFERSALDASDQWQLSFEDGVRARPTLSVPDGGNKLKESGTRVSVLVRSDIICKLLGVKKDALDDGVVDAFAKLIARLAPASPFDVYLKGCSSGERKVVGAHDWLSISDDELNSRVGSRAQTVLFPLHDGKGNVVGRVAPGHYRSYLFDAEGGAAGVYRGISAVRIPGLAGVFVLPGNNTNAMRTAASIDMRSLAWSDWAGQIADSKIYIPHSVYCLLHPLIRGRDLPVWQHKDESNTLSQLREIIHSLDAVVLHLGDVSHEDYDEFTVSDFDANFQLRDDVVIAPSVYYSSNGVVSMRDSFPWLIGFEKINYTDRFCAFVESCWGQVIEDDDNDVMVGEVRGVPVMRSGLLLRRSRSGSD
ncbi:TPA: ATP-binding protein [Stenotrophomonas maltophilia]|nr:ATP-binding protein [Stenotrophomonas maltophilia]